MGLGEQKTTWLLWVDVPQPWPFHMSSSPLTPPMQVIFCTGRGTRVATRVKYFTYKRNVLFFIAQERVGALPTNRNAYTYAPN